MRENPKANITYLQLEVKPSILPSCLSTEKLCGFAGVKKQCINLFRDNKNNHAV